MKKTSKFQILLLVLGCMILIFSGTNAFSVGSSVLPADVSIYPLGGNVMFVNRSDGMIYIYDSNLSTCIGRYQFHKLGEPISRTQ